MVCRLRCSKAMPVYSLRCGPMCSASVGAVEEQEIEEKIEEKNLEQVEGKIKGNTVKLNCEENNEGQGN